MRKILLAAFAVALTISLAADPGPIRYDFQQKTKTDPPSEKSKIIVGTVYLDRGMSRVNYAPESTSGAGTWVISRNGGRDMIYVDPKSRTYLVHSTPEMSDSLSDVQLRVSNLKIDTKHLGSGPVIAGYPTDHYRMTAKYDVSISLGPIPLVQHVETVIDKWTTQVFGDVSAMYFAGNLPHSGDPEIDRIIQAETTEASGFPLRQISTISTKVSDSHLPRGSQIKVQRSRRQTTELIVTRVGRTDRDSTQFQIPAGYTPLDQSSLLGQRGSFQNLTPEADWR